MKKFVNILTLIIMVSGNIMTPFAYAEPDAQVVDFFQETENAEDIEDAPEEVLEEVETPEEIDLLDEEDESSELEILEETEIL
jgi:hypothetical protein